MDSELKRLKDEEFDYFQKLRKKNDVAEFDYHLLDSKPKTFTNNQKSQIQQSTLEKQKSQLRADLKKQVNSQFTGIEDGKKFSPTKATVGGFELGVNKLAQTASNILEFGEDLLLSPFEAFAGQEIGTFSDTAPFNQLAKNIKEDKKEIDARHLENVQAGGKTGEILYYGTSAVTQALPQAWLAVATGGSSTALQSTAALQQTASAATSQSLTNTALQTVKKFSSNPETWGSFLETVGNSYETALGIIEETQPGLDNNEKHERATTYAILNGLVNAGFGHFGGSDGLNGDGWLKDIWNDGVESVRDGIVDYSLQNAMLGTDSPIFSLTDEDAVLSLPRAVQEFREGVFEGLLTDGMETGISKIASLSENPYIHFGVTDSDWKNLAWNEYLYSADGFGKRESDVQYWEAPYNSDFLFRESQNQNEKKLWQTYSLLNEYFASQDIASSAGKAGDLYDTNMGWYDYTYSVDGNGW